jgi:hypothetical protein
MKSLIILALIAANVGTVHSQKMFKQFRLRRGTNPFLTALK